MGARGIAAAGETPVQRRERWRHRPGSGKPGKVRKKFQAWEGEEDPSLPLTGFPKKAADGNRRNGKDGRAHTAGAEANTKPEVRSRVGEPF